MTTADGLFPPTGGSNGQWRLDTLLLCNWGGFGGVHSIEFNPKSTLLSGASGADKSTILDAYTTLVNPNLPLNRASNEAGARSRGEGTRTTLTYVRGQYDHVERDDVLVPLLLRGDGQDTWSVIAAVFASDDGAHITFFRVFHAPREASAPGEMKAVSGWYAGSLQPVHITEHFEPIAHTLAKREVETLPGMTVLSPGEYEREVQKKLNIGAHGDGAKALRLLYDLQRGKPVDRVSKLFRDMVLERPGTFDVAGKVVSSFDGLDDLHQQMARAEAQAAVLDGMDDDHAVIVAAQNAMSELDVLGVDRSSSPFALWATRYRDQLHADEIELLHEERASLVAQSEDAAARARDLKSERDIVDAEWRAEGGDAVKVTNDAIERLEKAAEDVRGERQRYEQQTAASGSPVPATMAEFQVAQAEARRIQATYENAKAALKETARAAGEPLWRAKDKLRKAERELEHLSSQDGNIPERLHLIRVAWADAVGVPASDLLFAGELIDVHEDWESWRTAADAVLGGLATTLLVDETRRHDLRRAINDGRFDTRVRFRGVTVNQPAPTSAADDTLAGRLVVKTGPFAGWLRQHLNREFRHECVETADQLGFDDTPRVTRNGQTQTGRQGAHGGNIARRIGFSNTQRRADLAEQIDTVRRDMKRLEQNLDEFDAKERELDAAFSASNWVAATRWADIDLATITTDLSKQHATRTRLLAASDLLDVLTNQMSRLDTDIENAQRTVWAHTIDAQKRTTTIDDLATKRTALADQLATLERDDSVTLTPEQADALDTELGRVDWDGSLTGFPLAITVVSERLSSVSKDAATRLAAAADRITNRFGKFHDHWPDNNRGTSLAEYDDYLTILDDLRGSGLAAQRRSWARAVIEWSGEDLSDLVQSYSKARFEIDERLLPIRRILATIPFGRGDTTLDVTVTHRSPEPVRVFMEQLRTLARDTMNPHADDATITAKFEAIREIVDRVRSAGGDQTMLLDVRRHLDAKARVVTDGLTGGRVYDHLGDKSGGESQLLTAFIVGAALRYHLGDEHRNRPGFAPVVLDEAFIKADGEFTGRAVEAWKQLGFQLIVGAPEDKFNALEPAMGLVIGITKDRSEFSYATPTPRADR